MDQYIGVDGCPAGWFAVWLDDQTSEAPLLRGEIVPSMGDLLASHPNARRILVDMPVGLLIGETRQVESHVRKLIGPRRSSVFSVPCFDAVYATNYELANQINRKRLGKGLSKQAWYLCPKIREVNDLLIRSPDTKKVIGECHPELAFTTLYGAHLQHTKKTPEGIHLRKQILSRVFPDLEAFIDSCMTSYKRKQLVIDDCLDALALLATAPNAIELDVTQIHSAKQVGVGEVDITMWLPAQNAS